jgi:hypothetical protein
MDSSVTKALEVLNNLVKLDSDAMVKLIEYRVECHPKVEEHSSVLVVPDPETGIIRYGLLGVLNAIFAEDSNLKVAAVFNASGDLLKFALVGPEHIL